MVVVNGNERLKIKKVRKHAWYKQELPKHQEILEIFICRNLVIEGDLNADDVPEETRITNIQKSEKSDIESSPGETKEILEAMKNMPTKYTPYYDCDDGDSLMHEVIEFAKLKKYSSKI